MAQHLVQRSSVQPLTQSQKLQEWKEEQPEEELASAPLQQQVDEMMESVKQWVYRNLLGEEWDTQPACIITDYVLAFQSFAFAAYIAYSYERSIPSLEQAQLWSFLNPKSPTWYLLYFIALGTSAGVGGFLHHVAYKASSLFCKNEKGTKQSPATTDQMQQRLFGFYMNRTTADSIIVTAWRIVLGFSLCSNFALFALAASNYLSEDMAWTIISVAATVYAILAVWAVINMATFFLLLGFIPTFFFGLITSVLALEWGFSAPFNELVVYLLKLTSGIIQGLVICPNPKFFNHNAFSHVMLSVAATFMLFHFELHA